MEPSLAIRKGYFAALDGNVTSGGNAVNIYDAFALPEQTNYPYILLSSQTDNQRIQKQCKSFNATILIDIVTGSTDPAGREQSELIADQIETIVNPDSKVDIDLSAHGYEIGDTWRGDSSEFSDKNRTYYIFRKLLRYNHLISKL